MKAITVWQPWASFLAAGVKLHETRSWNTQYRGKIAIHAGKKWDAHLQRTTDNLIARFPELKCVIDPSNPPLGVIVGTGRLVEMVKSDEAIRTIKPRERALGDWSAGRYGWKIDKAKTFAAPIAAQGAQGLWDWDGQRVIDRSSWRWVGRHDLFYNTPGGVDANGLKVGDIYDVVYPAKHSTSGIRHGWHGTTFVITWSWLAWRGEWSRMVCPIHEWDCSAAEIAVFERMRLEKAV